MRRATVVLAHGTWDPSEANPSVTLDHDRRHRRRIALETDTGEAFLLDLAQARHLRDGDGLLLEDGTRILVRARPEAVVEVTSATSDLLTRIAWHLGNRHLEVAFSGSRLLIREDHVIEDMVRRLGGSVQRVTAPFDPESGAYADHHGH